jgi:dCTP deaminase
MTVLSAQTLRKIRPVEPFVDRAKFNGMSYGLSSAGYDIRIDKDYTIGRGGFILAASMEEFFMPNNVIAIVHDKSSWARKGLFVQNTVIEPGWTGYLTIELTYHGHTPAPLNIPAGAPIAQIIFHFLDQPTEQPYRGKYQGQQAGPQEAIDEQ